MALTAEQRKILNAINRAADKYGAGNKVRKAAIETGLVESGLRNLHYGDADSLGFRQERVSIYGRKHALNPNLSAEDFVKEAMGLRNKYKRAGDLAAAVQRPAAQYRGRYQQVSREAQNLLKSSGRSPSASAGSKGGATLSAVDNSAERRSLLLNYLLNQQSHDSTGRALLETVQQIHNTPDTVRTVPKKVSKRSPSTPSAKGTITVDGKPVAAWIAKRLLRAKKAGWTGTVTSGYRSDAEQTRIYKSGVRPAAVPKSLGGSGSKHEMKAYPGGAVDVTNPAQLAAVLKKLGIKKLKYAGAKDRVHFSHPNPDGSY